MKFLDKHGAQPRQGFIRGKATRPVPEEVIGWPCLETEGITAFGTTAAGIPPLADKRWNVHASRHLSRPLLLVHVTQSQSGLTSAVCPNSLLYSQRYYGFSFPAPTSRMGGLFKRGIQLAAGHILHFPYGTGVGGRARTTSSGRTFAAYPSRRSMNHETSQHMSSNRRRRTNSGDSRPFRICITRTASEQSGLRIYRMDLDHSVLVEDILQVQLTSKETGNNPPP